MREFETDRTAWRCDERVSRNCTESCACAASEGGRIFKTHDFHLHVPEGAVPKDGPSAGVTMTTAIYSAVTGKKVLAKVAMTGEITLRGRVLPIGGLKEKLLAAKQAGIQRL